MPRGGRRSGTPGALYPNRSDLRQPIQAASGQTYGKRAEQMAAQRAVPVARPATDAVPAAPAAPTTRRLSAEVPGQLPGQVMPLDAPSQRPNEPVTAGLPVGAGGGLELLGRLGPPSEDDDGVKDLAMWLPLLEFATSQPGATAQLRNFVRRLRGATPVR